MQLEKLAEICAITPDSFELKALVLTFTFSGAVTTIRVAFDDEQSGAQMVITNMTTLPETATLNGWGSEALESLLFSPNFISSLSLDAKLHLCL